MAKTSEEMRFALQVVALITGCVLFALLVILAHRFDAGNERDFITDCLARGGNAITFDSGQPPACVEVPNE